MHGIFPILNTTFHPDGSLDLESQLRLVEYLLASGAHGLGLFGNASEGYALEAGTYERGRPEYPAALAGWLSGTLKLTAGATVVDVGAGTGKFTKMLQATGAHVVAVEPVDAMREKLAKLPGVRVVFRSSSKPA